MKDTPVKKTKKYYPTSLNLPLEYLEMIEKLDSIGKDVAEIRRRGAMKEIDREFKKWFSEK